MARPLTQDEPLDAPVRVRLTATERHSVKAVALAAGLSTSDFLRLCLTTGGPQVQARPTGLPTPGKRRPDLSKRRYTKVSPELLFHLAQIGNLTNQVAALLNGQNYIGQPLDILSAARSLKSIEVGLKTILEAHGG